MPKNDGTGPKGLGPRTGRGRFNGRRGEFECPLSKEVDSLTIQEEIEELELCKKNIEAEIERLKSKVE